MLFLVPVIQWLQSPPRSPHTSSTCEKLPFFFLVFQVEAKKKRKNLFGNRLIHHSALFIALLSDLPARLPDKKKRKKPAANKPPSSQ